VVAVRVKLCYGNVHYCHDHECRKNGLKSHASICVDDGCGEKEESVSRRGEAEGE
jgi:hypothetical protein